MIEEKITQCLLKTKIIQGIYPEVANIRYNIYDIPYEELYNFGVKKKHRIHLTEDNKTAYIIYSPFIDGVMNTDIWLFCNILK